MLITLRIGQNRPLVVPNKPFSLQHYNPLIDEAIHQAFDLPETWKLRAEMPFGSIETPAGEKDYLDDEAVFKLIK
mgnify:CR=1 FL=1